MMSVIYVTSLDCREPLYDNIVSSGLSVSRLVVLVGPEFDSLPGALSLFPGGLSFSDSHQVQEASTVAQKHDDMARTNWMGLPNGSHASMPNSMLSKLCTAANLRQHIYLRSDLLR